MSISKYLRCDACGVEVPFNPDRAHEPEIRHAHQMRHRLKVGLGWSIEERGGLDYCETCKRKRRGEK